MLNRLTNLECVRDWLGVTTGGDDILLTRLIDSASRFILSYIQRPSLFQNVYSDVYDGMRQRSQTLRHYPVLAVSTVLVNGQTIMPAPAAAYSAPGCGFVVDPWDGMPPGRPQAVGLRGYEFCQGIGNVDIVYTAGYVVQSEPQTVPTGADYSVGVDAPYGSWGADQGVTYATGAALTPLPYSDPTTLVGGQYMVLGGNYFFAAADASRAVLITYSYIPADIEHACMEIVGERYRLKDRIGMVSKSLAGQETMSYSQKSMSDFISSLLLPYKRVIPV